MNKRTRSHGSLKSSLAVPSQAPHAQADWREVSPVTQDAPGHTKRWLCHPRAELYFWRDAQGDITAFQFCFEEDGKEHMVAWDSQRPLHVGHVDAGESSPLHNRTPVMKNQVVPPSLRPQQRWREVRDGLPPGVMEFVERALGWG